MLLKNVVRRLKAAGNLLKLAEERGISNARKSTFYQSAMILLCSIAEALCYELAKRTASRSGHPIVEATQYRELHAIKAAVLSVSQDLFICAKDKKGLSVDDNGVDFGKFILFLKNHKEISYQKYKQLDWVRKQRNKVHLQGLSNSDTGYTKGKLDRVGEAIDYLITKLKS